MRRNRGFTLMELLIVITVVAVLSMIAIPQYVEYNIDHFNLNPEMA